MKNKEQSAPTPQEAVKEDSKEAGEPVDQYVLVGEIIAEKRRFESENTRLQSELTRLTQEVERLEGEKSQLEKEHKTLYNSYYEVHDKCENHRKRVSQLEQESKERLDYAHELAKKVLQLEQGLKEREWRAVAYHTTLNRVSEYGHRLPPTLEAEIQERIKVEPLSSLLTSKQIPENS